MIPNNDILLSESPDGQTQIWVQLQDETVWLTQAQMAELFDVYRPNVTMHLRKVFKEGELEEKSVGKESFAADGKSYRVKHYDLDVIISVGYRVNHFFSDGNKRIAAFLFVWFLNQNRCLYKPDGSRRLADNALVALTLLIAESKPEDKNTLVTLVVNLINQEN